MKCRYPHPFIFRRSLLKDVRSVQLIDDRREEKGNRREEKSFSFQIVPNDLEEKIFFDGTNDK